MAILDDHFPFRGRPGLSRKGLLGPGPIITPPPPDQSGGRTFPAQSAVGARSENRKNVPVLHEFAGTNRAECRKTHPHSILDLATSLKNWLILRYEAITSASSFTVAPLASSFTMCIAATIGIRALAPSE
jgi:hypothetical protein